MQPVTSDNLCIKVSARQGTAIGGRLDLQQNVSNLPFFQESPTDSRRSTSTTGGHGYSLKAANTLPGELD
jgi:hypothetical protein